VKERERGREGGERKKERGSHKFFPAFDNGHFSRQKSLFNLGQIAKEIKTRLRPISDVTGNKKTGWKEVFLNEGKK
jgi:hypothetical protein